MPREGHDGHDYHQGIRNAISIHVPREGHDVGTAAAAPRRRHFNPRAPRGARPHAGQDRKPAGRISIHVPREGHDATARGRKMSHSHFNPRAPRGARPRAPVISLRMLRFQSTCPARGTTLAKKTYATRLLFQSTCPARGTTTIQPRVIGAASYFNPRAPRGARLGLYRRRLSKFWISIHVPREGHDMSLTVSVFLRLAFQSTCPARGTTR